MIYHIKKFFWRVKNTWLWIKFIWNIRWYEYSQLYQTLKLFLQRMIQYFKNAKTQYVGIERDLEYMQLCIKLIERLESNFYEDAAYEEIEKRWGKAEFIFTPVEGHEDLKELHIKRDFIKTEEDQEIYDDEYSKTIIHWRNKHEKAKRLLFKILEEKIERWWI